MTTPAELETLAVIGNGIIGHGIAQVFAVAGYDVRMIGRNTASLDARGNAFVRVSNAFRRTNL